MATYAGANPVVTLMLYWTYFCSACVGAVPQPVLGAGAVGGPSDEIAPSVGGALATSPPSS